MSRVSDIVNHQNSPSDDLGSDWLGDLRPFGRDSNVLVKLDLHIGKIPIFQKIAHDSSWRPTSPGDSHDDFRRVTCPFDLTRKFYHHIIDIVPARSNIFRIPQRSKPKRLARSRILVPLSLCQSPYECRPLNPIYGLRDILSGVPKIEPCGKLSEGRQ